MKRKKGKGHFVAKGSLCEFIPKKLERGKMFQFAMFDKKQKNVLFVDIKRDAKARTIWA